MKYIEKSAKYHPAPPQALGYCTCHTADPQASYAKLQGWASIADQPSLQTLMRPIDCVQSYHFGNLSETMCFFCLSNMKYIYIFKYMEFPGEAVPDSTQWPLVSDHMIWLLEWRLKQKDCIDNQPALSASSPPGEGLCILKGIIRWVGTHCGGS